MLAPSIFLEKIDDLHGDWPREQLVQMNDLFTAAVERAFELGLESRAAAGATVRVGSSLNGSRRLAEDAAIQAAWRWFADVKFQATAVEVLARVRASYSAVTAEQVREEFRRRLMASSAGGGLV
jgi:hypothetical protein